MTGDIVARARAALEGIDSLLPWVCYNHPPSTDYAVMARYINDRGRESWWDLASEGSWWSEGNAKFVSQAPGLVAGLADEVERLRAAYAELEALPGPGFDEWLSEHDREVAARTLREAVELFADELGSAGSSILLGHADVTEKGEVDV